MIYNWTIIYIEVVNGEKVHAIAFSSASGGKSFFLPTQMAIVPVLFRLVIRLFKRYTHPNFHLFKNNAILYLLFSATIRCLPPAFFRFHLAMDILALGYHLPAIRVAWGLAPTRLPIK